MSSHSELRHHIKVVEETKKITKAMHLIASSKMKRAMEMRTFNEAYFHRIRSDIKYIIEHSGELVNNINFHKRLGSRALYIVVTSDKGLCGSYNQNVLTLAHAHMQSREERFIFTIGQISREYFSKLGIRPDVDYLHVIQKPSLYNARRITLEVCDLYNQNLMDEVYIVFTEMLSMIKQTPRVMRLLPILHEDFDDVVPLHGPDLTLSYHPTVNDVLDTLVPQYLIGLTYSALVQSFASEQSARMQAMDASTRSADDMLAALTTQLHRVRQAAITQELSEIASGSEVEMVRMATTNLRGAHV